MNSPGGLLCRRPHRNAGGCAGYDRKAAAKHQANTAILILAGF
jgi:hypothetical protein